MRTRSLLLSAALCLGFAQAEAQTVRTVAQFLSDCDAAPRGVACSFPIYMLWQDSALCTADPSSHDHICPPKSSHPDSDAAEDHAAEVAQWLQAHPEMKMMPDRSGIIEATRALFPCPKK